MSRKERSVRRGCAMGWASARGRLEALHKNAGEKGSPTESLRLSLELASQISKSFSRSNGGIAIMLEPFDEFLVPKKKIRKLVDDFFAESVLCDDFGQENLGEFEEHFYFLIGRTLSYLDNNFECYIVIIVIYVRCYVFC
jgi:hypothetical protein